ncbi:hypothetical protein CNMCM5793_003812 [Aspergillus hiratsukae]|uniref:HNH nuclease domain-containing protein n=1 Tax=Aspergillus hiratsukae TaxID=1194566 RepID=A0A8H6PSR8_9EURO|nr:hypothetical protein CNMCM5793_003812 [Aspergillus hiratsukae]KAF7159396.1 hypothetical protein CNMCM6106_006609 [Aspergillus hiratsukae]
MSSKKHKWKPSDQLSEASSERRRSRRIAGQPADDQQPLQAASLRSPQMVAARASRRANADIAAADIDDELQTRDEDFTDACLQRDGHRCVVSGVMDAGRWEKLDCPEDVMALDLEAAHIIPTPQNVVDIWTILGRYFPGVQRAGMNFRNNNDPSNGMMLIPDLHVQFGKFLMAFEATDVPHTYKLKIYPRFRSGARQALPKDGIVTFTKAEGAENIPLPNPVLLDSSHRRVAPADNKDKASNKTADSKASTTQRCFAREPARPCHHCSGKRWDNDCSKEPKQSMALFAVRLTFKEDCWDEVLGAAFTAAEYKILRPSCGTAIEKTGNSYDWSSLGVTHRFNVMEQPESSRSYQVILVEATRRELQEILDLQDNQEWVDWLRSDMVKPWWTELWDDHLSKNN